MVGPSVTLALSRRGPLRKRLPARQLFSTPRVENLESRLLLAGVEFLPHPPVAEMDVDNPTDVYAADLDGDGDTDLLSASWQDGKIAWYENTDGAGTFGPQQVIIRGGAAADVYATDVDGDRDLDVLSASLDGVAWFENTDGQGTFAQRLLFEGSRSASAVYADDMDGDGDVDVIAASSGPGSISWYQNIDGAGTFGPQQAIVQRVGGVNCVYAADLDGDGDEDLVAAAGQVAWFQNTDGTGTFGPQRVLSSDPGGVTFVYPADVDGDGKLDVVSAFLYHISWHTSGDRPGLFRRPQDIDATKGAGFICAADMDQDGDLDILSNKGWYANIDGAGVFGNEQAIVASYDAARHVTDVDGDGDLDVLATGDDTIAWYENADGKASSWRRHFITTRSETGFSAYAADLDADGDLDLLSATSEGNTTAWHENTDGQGSFGPRKVIAIFWNAPARSVYAADVDDDGDNDVLSVSTWIQMYDNTDGFGTFGPPQTIDVSTEPSSFHVADLDGDGDLDLLSTTGSEIVWYENEDGEAVFGPKQAITADQIGLTALSAYAADVDNDGDLDVVSVSWWNDSIIWYENTDGVGTSWFRNVVPMEGSRGQVFSVHLSDLDGDSDLDMVVADDDNAITWYENTDGAGRFNFKQRIMWGDHSGPYAAGNGDTPILPPTAIHAADVDGDGDMDVLSALGEIAWYENTGHFDRYWPRQVIRSGLVWARSVFAADVDNDNDLDIVYAAHSGIGWAENTSGADETYEAGDANRDKRFDQQDIVQVLQSAKYLTGAPASWHEGDWNVDGVFDQLDITAALQVGNYLQRPYGARGDHDVLLARTTKNESRIAVLNALLAEHDDCKWLTPRADR